MSGGAITFEAEVTKSMETSRKRVSVSRAHPWHGVSIGIDAPNIVTCYIEIVPTDTVKYEIDKPSGYLRIDRPQRFSNVCPTLYGFLPRTLCAERTAALSVQYTGRGGLRGDLDPLDVCVFSERSIAHGDILLEGVPIGGIRMLDNDEADDKLLAVLAGDAIYGKWENIEDIDRGLLDRIIHYFLTYKRPPGEPQREIIVGTFGRQDAYELILEAQRDYEAHFQPIPSPEFGTAR
ncbi:MAG TPA: inorganic pyrophosphatase, partial [Bryobacteraceae bacterium]|nr:inorganic pyrophosphatase [Bryobacteraceae bacterium]